MAVRLPDFDPVEFLVSRKYPSALMRFVAAGGNVSGGGQRDGRSAIIDALAGEVGKVDAYREELRTKPAEELAQLVTQERQKQQEERLRAEELEEQKHFFNQPLATTVDYTHWAKMGTWTVNEAIALSMGRNPKQVNWELIKGKPHSPFVQAYTARQDLVLRGNIPWENVGVGGARVKPEAFYNWLVKLELDFPKALQKELVKFAGAVDWKYSYETLMEHSRKTNAKLQEVTQALIKAVENQKKTSDKPLSTTERNTLLKIIYSMAKDNYGFTPGVKGSAATDIEKAATAAGIKIDADTARKWLKAAGDYCKEQGAE